MRYEPRTLRAQCKVSFCVIKMPVGGHRKVDIRTAEFANGFDYLGDHAFKLIVDDEGAVIAKAHDDIAANSE